MLSYFYKSIKKTSHEQLVDDFGEFPPIPLVSRAVPYHFRVVHVRGAARIFNVYAQWLTALTALKEDPSSVAPGVHSLVKDIREHISGLASPKVEKGKESAAFTIRIPVRIAAAIAAFGWARYQRSRTRCYGYYFPTVTYDAQVTIEAKAASRPQGNASVISHEHIHFLQHCNDQVGGKLIPGASLFLSEEKSRDPMLLYLLERNEVEARLHEIVLSGYRAGHFMPVTLASFLSLLCACKELETLLIPSLKLSGIEVGRNGPSFEARDSAHATDLEVLIVYSKDDEMACRFATEVLSVMYGNLLRYYGDNDTSASFLQQIARPNLYDELYGLKSA